MYYGAFPQGITNGADWYIITGSLQDWSYFATGCIDVTVEMSDVKWPPASQLGGFWDDNRDSYLHFIRSARYGVNGVVTDATTGLPLDATVTVMGNAKPVYTDPEHGDYYKLLDTGTYDLVFTADGYVSKTVTAVATVWGTPTVLDVALAPDTSDLPAQPGSGILLAAAPNPFNPRTTFTITLERAGPATLDIFDLTGRRIRRLLDRNLPAGPSEAVWDGRNRSGEQASSGVYFAQLSRGSRRDMIKVVLVK
jgi:hypothetical protein